MRDNRLRANSLLLAILLGAWPLAAAPQLKYVVIVSRHGVRSPTWSRERLRQYSAEPWPDFGVPPGDLTPHGRDLIKILGSYYREWFAADHLLAPSGCADAQRVYIWADTDQRTLETGRAFAESLVPGCGLSIHSRPQGERDPLFSGSGNPDTRAAADAVHQRLGPDPQALLKEHRGELDTLQFILTGGKDAPQKLLGPSESIAAVIQGNNVELQGPFSTASTMTENLLLEYADGMQRAQFGWGRVTKDDLIRVLALHRVYADLMRRTPYLARARGSNLMTRILASMEQAVSGKASPGALGSPGTALLILSGHDTNQANVAGMLGLSWSLPGYQPDETPPGGALIFSLWRNSEDGQYFVRTEFLAASLDQMHDASALTPAAPPLRQQVSLPACGASDCPWSGFEKILQTSIDGNIDFGAR